MYASSPDPEALARERASKRFEDYQKRQAEKEERKAREEEKLLRYKEKQPEDEIEAVEFDQWRERDRKRLEKEKRRLKRMGPERKAVEEERRHSIAGLDLVSLALEDPSQLDDIQRDALLGYTPYPPDSEAFVKLLSGYKEYRKKRDLSDLILLGQLSDSLRSPVLCKYMLCDGRIPDAFHAEDVQEHASFDADAVVERLYSEQLQLEKTDDPLERARAAVRSVHEQRVRYLAHRMLLQFQEALTPGVELDDCQLRRMKFEVLPGMPIWAVDALKEHSEMTLPFYSTSEVFQDRPVALKRWRRIFEESRDCENYDEIGYRIGRNRLGSSYELTDGLFPTWVDDVHPSEKRPAAIRR
jgi:hypothetical protein